MPDISKIQFPNGDEYNIKDASAVHDHMVVLSYGHSTWEDFIDAYNTNTVVYCRASSNANPATGSQTRLAFMAYVNNSETPTNVEFQYYRSVNSHSISQQGDQVFVYKLDKTNGWSVTTREASSEIVAGDGLSSAYTEDTVTLAADVLSVNSQTGAITLNADNLNYDSTYTIKGKIDTIIASGGEPNVIETVQQNGSALPVSNKTVNVTVPTKTSDLTNDSNFAVDANYIHTDNNFTSTLKTKLEGIASGAEVNQNTFSNVKIDSTTIIADSKTDTLELIAGSNITLTPDATNDKITIAATDTTYENKSAASSGTDISLVTTGEKYTWNNKQNALSFDGTYSSSNKVATVSTITNAINALDGGTIGTGSTTKTITALSQTNGNVSATFSNIAFPVTSVNSKTGAVSLTASDVGALPSSTTIPTKTSDLTNDSDFVEDASYVHTDNNFTTALKNKLDGIASGAEVNQNAFSNVTIGSTTIAADSKTDTLTLVAGNNITLTPDATNDKVTIAATDTTYGIVSTSANGLAPKVTDTTKFLKGDGTWATPTDTNNAVTQTATTTSADYEVLFSATADNTTRTEGARKNSNLKFNPSTGNLQATQLNGVTIGSSPKFTDNNTTYTFANGTNGFTVTPSGGTAQTVTVTPSIANNVTGSGTSGYIAKFNGTNTITNGPAFSSATTTYLRNDGNWATPTDTKNTAGSTASDSKMFLIGATSQAANPQTYSNANIYGTAGVLNATSYSINAAANIVYNSINKSIDFTFN